MWLLKRGDYLKTKRLVLLTVSFMFVALLVSPVLAAAFWDTLAGFQKPVKAATRQAKAVSDDSLVGYGIGNDISAYADSAADCEIWRVSRSGKVKSADTLNATEQGSQTALSAMWITPSHLNLLLKNTRLAIVDIATARQGPSELALGNADTVSARGSRNYFGIAQVNSTENRSANFHVGVSVNVNRVQFGAQTSSVPEPSAMLAACALLAPAALVFRRRKNRL